MDLLTPNVILGLAILSLMLISTLGEILSMIDDWFNSRRNKSK